MITGAACVGKMLFYVEDCLMVKQTVENISCFAFSGTDRQDAEIAVLI